LSVAILRNVAVFFRVLASIPPFFELGLACLSVWEKEDLYPMPMPPRYRTIVNVLSAIVRFSLYTKTILCRCKIEWVGRVLGAHLFNKSLMALPLIPLLRQGITSKFSNPTIPHLISPMDLSLKIRILPFSELPLLITG
jgi:hypothetical protein